MKEPWVGTAGLDNTQSVWYSESLIAAGRILFDWWRLRALAVLTVESGAADARFVYLTITSFASIIVISCRLRFVNRFLTLDNHSIGNRPRLCINAQLLVSMAENRCGPICIHEYGVLMRCVACTEKSSDHGDVP